MVDIHQHLLYGIDDGAASFSETQGMLTASGAQGVETVFATSHAMPGRRDFSAQEYLLTLENVRRWLSENARDTRVLPGNEILYSSQAVPMLRNGELFTLGGSDAVLVEFFPEVEASDLLFGLRELINAGYVPVLAHTERYFCLRKKEGSYIDVLRSMEVRLQVNAHSVIRASGIFGDGFLKRLLREGYVDYVASDAHNTGSRAVCMKQARNSLGKLIGGEAADALCGGNQARDLM